MGKRIKHQLVFRGDSEKAVQQKLEEWGVSRVFLVTGRESYVRSGAQELIKTLLQDRATDHFDSFSANPFVSDLLNGLDRFHQFKPDCILAVGGGSVMDMAKLINFFGPAGIRPDQFFAEGGSVCRPTPLPLIAVPTTSGSGSEATRFAVVYKAGVKHSVEADSLIPDVAVLIPGLTSSLSPYQTACSGFDALAQAIESYWAPGATSVSKQYSSEAAKLCLKHLEQAVVNPVSADRAGLMDAAYLAGKAINMTKTTAAHACSYFLTARYGLPHGHAVAMMFPAVFEFNMQEPGGEMSADVIQELCRMFASFTPAEALEKIRSLCLRIGLDQSWVKQAGASLDEIRSGLIREVNKDRLLNNPRRVCIEDLRWIAWRSFSE